jgi:hypothetical protein
LAFTGFLFCLFKSLYCGFSRSGIPEPGVSHASAAASDRCIVDMRIGPACGRASTQAPYLPGTTHHDTKAAGGETNSSTGA